MQRQAKFFGIKNANDPLNGNPVGAHYPLQYLMGYVKTMIRTGCLLFLAFPTLLHGQALRDTLFEAVRREVEPLVAQSVAPKPLGVQPEANLYIVDALLSIRDETLEPLPKDPLYDLRVKEQKRDWGLALRSQVYHNFDEINVTQDEIDDRAYPTRLRLGLEWDVFKDGLASHRTKARILENEKEIEWIQFDSRRNEERLAYRHNVLRYYFNQQKIRILEARQQRLSKQLGLLYRVFYFRDILFEEVLAVKSSLEQVEVQLKNYRAHNALIEHTLQVDAFPGGVDVEQLPVVDIDIWRLLKDSLLLGKNDKLLQLEALNDQLQSHWAHDVSLRLQLHQNFAIASPNLPDKVYQSVGFTASVPLELVMGYVTDNQLMAAAAKDREQYGLYQQTAAAAEIIGHYYDYSVKLKQYVQNRYKQLLFAEKLRIELVNRAHFTEFYQPFQLLKYADQLQEVELEMVDLRQQMYLALLEIYAKTPLKSLRPYLFPVVTSQYFNRLPGSRTIFIKKRDFDRHDRKFLADYLHFNDFQYAILPETEVYNLPQQHQAVLPGNSVTRLIRTVKWGPAMRYPDKAVGDLLQVLDADGVHGCQLFVHPSDYVGKVNAFQAALREVLVELDRQRPSMPVFLSVPADFPLHHLAEIGIWVEKIILRVEEGTGLEPLKLVPEKLLPFEHLAVCVEVDVKQFHNRLKMEAYINQLMASFPVDDIVFNDFQAFLDLDTKVFSE